jgi:hypothetical protein
MRKTKKKIKKRDPNEKERFCIECLQVKPIDFFSEGSNKNQCRPCKAEYSRAWRIDRYGMSGPRWWMDNPAYESELLWALRFSCLHLYGAKCVCCGMEDIEFLTIDHKNNDGKEQRANRHPHSGRRFYRWLWNHAKQLPDFQVLCMNCNSAKGWYGQCPHERRREDAVILAAERMAA